MSTRARERIYGLDLLRAIAMFLGILLHSAMAFTSVDIPYWPVRDPSPSVFADLLIVSIKGFRMQLFFFLAGFFGAMVYERRGLNLFLRNRMLRIGIPLAFSILIIQPILQALWIKGRTSSLVPSGIFLSPDGALLDHFISGHFLNCLSLMHFWFLYYLLALYGVVALFHVFTPGLSEFLLVRLRGVLARPYAVGVLAVFTAPLLWPMKYWGMIDMPNDFFINPMILVYYLCFFLGGWTTWGDRGLLTVLSHGFPTKMLFGLFVFLPLSIACMLYGLHSSQNLALARVVHLVSCLSSAFYSWLMVIGLIGAILALPLGNSGVIRYLSDSAYWCYLWHLPLILALQELLLLTSVAGLPSFLLVVSVSTATLVATYQLLVRNTLIGTILNGKRQGILTSKRRSKGNGIRRHRDLALPAS